MLLRHALLGVLALGLLFTNVSADYEYWGCVEDAIAMRAVPNLLLRGDSMTIQVCEDLARQQGFAVFGMEYSTECFGSE
jgi:hypothetical protein